MQPWTQSTIDDYSERNFDDLEMARGLAYMRSKDQAEAMKKRHASAEASLDYYFKINDWVKRKNYPANKFEFSGKGPYAVVDVGFPGTYWLMDTNGRRLDSTVNQRDLAPWLSGINDNQSYFHDGTNRSSNPESTDEPLDVYLSTLYDRYMGDCVIS